MPDDHPLLRDQRKGAVFDEDEAYRYRLWRIWDREKPTVVFVMLNPSTADATQLDATCRRCKAYAKAWGYGGFHVGNLFALRATNPQDLYEHPAPIGPDNNQHLLAMADQADQVIAAWGTHGEHQNRGQEVTQMLHHAAGIELTCLAHTQDGHPTHPLYQPADKEPITFNGYPEGTDD